MSLDEGMVYFGAQLSFVLRYFILLYWCFLSVKIPYSIQRMKTRLAMSLDEGMVYFGAQQKAVPWFISVHNRHQYSIMIYFGAHSTSISRFILVHNQHQYHGLFWCTIDISILVYFYAKWTLASWHLGLSYSCVIQRTPIFWICADVNRIGPPPSCPDYVVIWLERFFDIPTRWLCFFLIWFKRLTLRCSEQYKTQSSVHMFISCRRPNIQYSLSN